ncbi:hypothetical protein [Polycladidibacter stylochi]|uniref:hypothetical protein n=1 Tax=Polycladidibacter stylochi TaxID=1807766 RepID=UPI0008299312|nr:hypothetical protein [Pseudovibrio stylochi]
MLTFLMTKVFSFSKNQRKKEPTKNKRMRLAGNKQEWPTWLNDDITLDQPNQVDERVKNKKAATNQEPILEQSSHVVIPARTRT